MVTESTETAAETPTELEELRRSGRVVTDGSDAVEDGNRYRRTALTKIDEFSKVSAGESNCTSIAFEVTLSR